MDGMRKAAFLAGFALFILAGSAWPQSGPPQKTQPQPPEKIIYGNMPRDAVPYGRFRKAYKDWFIEPNTLEYNGAARSVPAPSLQKLSGINIGFLGPLGPDNPDSPYGIAMLHGAQLAIEDANADGGYDGKPFVLKIHDDLPLWGASSMEIVKMDFDEHVWAMLGAIDGASTHIALRATLKLEIPIIDTGTTDPTVTETRVQWLLHDFPDDRQQGYALADYVFNNLKLKRVAIIRANDRYGRKGDEKFIDMARRMGHEPILLMKYSPDQKDFSKLLDAVRSNHADALLLWGDAEMAGRILKQMRALGMKQPVFGSSRIAYPEVIRVAGPAAEGLVAVSAIDPSRQDPNWQAFRQDFLKRFQTEPDPYASYAYDGMTILIAAIRKAGLNRARIMDALREHEMKPYQGVSGRAFFDYALNNIAAVTFARVKDGHFEYWRAIRTDEKGEAEAAGR
jgi:branched-chain amino acid transport system substrate-binding protein